MTSISDGKLELVFGDPQNWPVLNVTQANQLNLENADFNLEANRSILFSGKGQISSLGDISFLTGATPPTEQMKIFANGNIGIGTGATVPTNKLEVAGTIKATGLEVSGTITANKFVGEVAGLADSLNDKISKTGGTITGSLTIQNNLTVSGSLKLGDLTVNKFSSDGTFNGNSDLAIPTEKAVKTYVDNIAVTEPKIADGAVTPPKIANGAVTTSKIADKSITVAKLSFSLPSGSSQWQDTAGGSISYSKGNVGIGTSTPQDKLDVAGNLQILTNSNPIRFTSAWSDFSAGSPASATNHAEISNDTGNYKALMIVGNKSAGGVRKVAVWDNLQINGGMGITGAIMPSAGSSENAGIMFPKDPGGGSGDAAWMRYYARTGEACTLEIGTSNNADDHIALMPSGNVGIGTTNPTKGKVHIEGSVINDVSPFAYYAIEGQRINSDVEIQSDPQLYSLYANQRIAATEFNAFSDTRIKEIQGRSDSQNDLQTLLQIEVTDYYYRDKIVNGDRQHKKVIGQQVATVFPQAVKTHTDVVPDILKPASIADGWVSLPAHGLQVGERVRLLLEGVEPQIYTIEAVTPDSFQVSLDFEGEVFVYGREVNDFHVVDYHALAMLNISATQELYKIIDALKAEVQQLKAQLNGSHHPIAAFSSP